VTLVRQICKALLITACLGAVTGCAQLNVGTAWSLRDLDFMTVDPRTVRLALALPDGASIREATVTMQFRRQETLLIDETLELEIIKSGVEVDKVGFPTHLTNRFVLKVPASRIDVVVNYQRLLLREREAGSGASATFGIGSRMDPDWLEEHCASGNGPITVSAWVLVNETQGYLPLFDDSPLGKLINAQAQDVCAKSQ
jgi:hypothetical protein